MKWTNHPCRQCFPFLSDFLSTFFILQSGRCNPTCPGAFSHCSLPEYCSLSASSSLLESCTLSTRKSVATERGTILLLEGETQPFIPLELSWLWVMQHLPDLSGMLSDVHGAGGLRAIQQARDHSFEPSNESKMLQESLQSVHSTYTLQFSPPNVRIWNSNSYGTLGMWLVCVNHWMFDFILLF